MAYVQELCDELVANDATLTQLDIFLREVDDAELKQILDAAKNNTTVKKVCVEVDPDEEMPLSVPATLSLASVVSEHPQIQEIQFCNVNVVEFGPIALAIQQNRKLTSLQLFGCLLTPNLVECIRWLLTENALESVTIGDIISEEGESFDISGALLGNSSLKELALYGDSGVIGLEIFQAIPHMIRSKQYFESVVLTLCESMPDRFELLRLVAQAAEGHASLNKLAIHCEDNTRDSDDDNEPSAEDLINYVGSAEAIGTMLHNAPALRELSLSHCYMGSAGARHLADGLSSENSVVKKLNLYCNNIDDAGALELAAALGQNNTLELVDLRGNTIGSHGAKALANALVTNDALNYINLYGSSIGDDGATSIAEMLTRNESIDEVHINGFGEEGLSAFVIRLPHMSHVKTIKLHIDVRGFTHEIGNALVQALEQNTTLETFNFNYMSPPWEVMPQVERLLALNRGGRRLLSVTGESVPPLNYWPRILARSSTDCRHGADVLFYFLREIPNVLVAKAGSRKRKRGDDEETSSSTVHHI